MISCPHPEISKKKFPVPPRISGGIFLMRGEGEKNNFLPPPQEISLQENPPTKVNIFTVFAVRTVNDRSTDSRRIYLNALIIDLI